MKKIIVLLMVILCIWWYIEVPSAFAQEFAPLVKFNGLNLQGDTLFLPEEASFAIGVGSNIATIKDFFELRATYVDPLEGGLSNRAGIGIGVSIPKLITKIGGTWIADKINVSIGAMALVDFAEGNVEPAIYLTIISIQY